MTSTTFAFAPAGVLGSGSVVARPYPCADVRPALLGAVAGVEVLGAPATGLPWAGKRTAAMAPRVRADQPIGMHDPITQNDGTTPLGIRPRGRSTS
jgi:hypothetical protein